MTAPCVRISLTQREVGAENHLAEVPPSLQTDDGSSCVICYHVACLFTVSANGSHTAGSGHGWLAAGGGGKGGAHRVNNFPAASWPFVGTFSYLVKVRTSAA